MKPIIVKSPIHKAYLEGYMESQIDTVGLWLIYIALLFICIGLPIVACIIENVEVKMTMLQAFLSLLTGGSTPIE